MPTPATAPVRTSVWHNKATAEAGGDGGGIYNQGTLWLLNVTIANNQTDGGVGGGLHNRGVMIATSSTITTNGAAAGGGIGMRRARATAGARDRRRATSRRVSISGSSACGA